jgi:hypothetical protein
MPNLVKIDKNKDRNFLNICRSDIYFNNLSRKTYFMFCNNVLYGLKVFRMISLKTKLFCFIQGLSPYRAVNTLHIGYTKPIC